MFFLKIMEAKRLVNAQKKKPINTEVGLLDISDIPHGGSYEEKEEWCKKYMKRMGIDYTEEDDEEDKKIQKRLKKEEEKAILKNKIADTKRNEKSCSQYIKRRMKEEHAVSHLQYKIKTEHKTYNVRQIEYDLAEGDTVKAKLLFLKKYYLKREGVHSASYYKKLNGD